MGPMVINSTVKWFYGGPGGSSRLFRQERFTNLEFIMKIIQYLSIKNLSPNKQGTGSITRYIIIKHLVMLLNFPVPQMRFVLWDVVKFYLVHHLQVDD